MRLLFLILLTFSSLLATDITAKYKVTFGIFGQIGIADLNIHVDANHNYDIKVHARSTGFVKMISGNREEWYESYGKISEKGIFIPTMYTKTIQRQSMQSSNNTDRFFNSESTNSLNDVETIVHRDVRSYIFLHDIKALVVEQTKQKGKEIRHETKKGDYYAENDLLSLFFNFKKTLPNLDVKKSILFYAVGANKTDGKIEVMPVDNLENAKIDLNYDTGHMLKVVIYDDVFGTKNGQLLLNLDDNGFPKKAVLKDVLLFGDIHGELIG